MAKRKLPLYGYSELLPVGQLTLRNDACFLYSDPVDFEWKSKLTRGALRFLKKRPDIVEDLIKLHGRLLTPIILFGDVFDVAASPNLMSNLERKARDRFGSLYSRHPEFTLAYLQELMRLLKTKSKLVQAAAFIRTQQNILDSYGRTVSIANATIKEISSASNLPEPSVRKARQELARFDNQMWGIQRKGKKSK